LNQHKWRFYYMILVTDLFLMFGTYYIKSCTS
jgi:hypothetical protein